MRKPIDHSFLRLAALAMTVVALLLGGTGCSNLGSQEGIGNFHTIIVDAGHGGSDRGARARSGLHEKYIALDTAQRLAKVLRSRGFRVIETRQSDYFITLGSRVNASNRENGAIFVSVHYNWAPRSYARGIEIYYYNPRSRPLAANILQRTLRAYPTLNRGVKRNNYYVLRNNRRPAVLCELGFLSNPQDNGYAQNPACRQRLAEAIADGIAASKR
jgi:N-acetylmuramoyl-L-alanine amidase